MDERCALYRNKNGYCCLIAGSGLLIFSWSLRVVPLWKLATAFFSALDCLTVNVSKWWMEGRVMNEPPVSQCHSSLILFQTRSTITTAAASSLCVQSSRRTGGPRLVCSHFLSRLIAALLRSRVTNSECREGSAQVRGSQECENRCITRRDNIGSGA